MNHINDDRIPFICNVTKEDCGAQINHLFISDDNNVLVCIPLSSHVLEFFDSKLKNKIKRTIIKELKNLL